MTVLRVRKAIRPLYSLMAALLIQTMLLVPAAWGDIIGRASVIDGDTIEIHGQRIRLYGIDAPESRQTCRKDGRPWRCGQQAALTLDKLIIGKTIRCVKKDRDHYGCLVGECFAGDLNLNAFMVEHGWALAYRQYSTAYIHQEEQAREAHTGIWASAFIPPWEYRHGNSPVSASAMPQCRIKGNINAGGEKIYHLPGSSWYNRTKIDILKGERWFCSEAEAQTAGWRKAGH
jgi:endonuclease YncB( thermonuclease family)